MPTKCTITTLKRLPSQFNMSGQVVARPLQKVDDAISPGFVQRLVSYSMERLIDAGFAVSDWQIEVETTTQDGSGGGSHAIPPSERVYHVTFTNAKGGWLAVQGIFCEAGWPRLDHGFAVGVR